MKTETIRVIAMGTALFAVPAFCADLEVGDGASANTYSDTAAYAAAGKIVKNGTGKTTLDLGDMTSSFAGEIEVFEGTLAVASTPASFGAPTKITVHDGATLDLSWTGNATGRIPDAEIAIKGDGFGNGGAIRRTAGSTINGLLGTVSLNGNARITLSTQVGVAGPVWLNGNALTKDGSDVLYCPNTLFYGEDGTTDDPGDIVVAGGTLFLSGSDVLQGGSAKNTITVEDGKTLKLRDTGDIAWAVKATGSATITSDGSVSDSSRNRLCGPVSAVSSLTVNPATATTRISFHGNDLEFGGDLLVNGIGPVTFTDMNISNTAAGNVTVQRTGIISSLVLDGDTVMASAVDGSGRAQSRIRFGETAGRYGTMAICGNSVVTNYGLAIGRESAGALYQRGGMSYWPVSNASNDRSANSSGSYGYLGLTGGRFAFDANGSLVDGKATHFGTYGTFVMATHGGSADFASSDNVGIGVKGGTFVYYQDGGTTNTFDGEFGFGLSSDAAYSGHAAVTVAGAGTELVAKTYLRMLWSVPGAEAFVNINDGGVVCVQNLYRLSQNAAMYLNLDGGTLRTYAASTYFTYKNEAKRYPTAAVVFEGGFAVDTSGGNTSMAFPFVSPGAEGRRIASIALPAIPSSEKLLVGSPVVAISGDGEGASAFALFDDTTRTVTNIVVTSHGWGYTAATATLSGGGLAGTYECAVTLEDQPSDGWKGFAKKGAGTLTMTGANTFKGDVTVEDGTLQFSNSTVAQGGMPEGAGVTVNENGILSFASDSTPVTVPFLAGCGSISRGYFTVTDRIECSADDLFAGRYLKIAQRLALADGARIVITDPERLPLYKKSGKATVVACQKGTLTLGGSVSLAFAEDAAATSANRWKLTFSDKSVTVSAIKGAMLTFR